MNDKHVYHVTATYKGVQMVVYVEATSTGMALAKAIEYLCCEYGHEESLLDLSAYPIHVIR